MAKTSEIYSSLYHYTTWEGLQGILKSGSLWATHCRFLNDYSEILLFREKLIELLLPNVEEAYTALVRKRPEIKKQIDEEGGLRYLIHHDTEAFVDAQYHAVGEELYILSFCGEHQNPHVNRHGLLSQWRGYGIGGGFATVFNTKQLEDILDIESKTAEYNAMHLSDLVYSDDFTKLREKMSEELIAIASDVKDIFNHERLADSQSDLTLKGYLPFVTCISRYKHHGFSEETKLELLLYLLLSMTKL